MEDISRDIIERAQAGDIDAFEAIYKATSGFVFNVSLRVVNNRQEAQEVTQDVFVKIYHSLKEFEFRSSFSTWAYRIAVNTALNACKRSSKHDRRRQDLESVIDTRAAAVDSQDELIKKDEQQQARATLESLLARLNPDQRACIVLREIEGFSYEEISRTLRINLNTVRTRLKRARVALMARAGGG